MKVLSKGQALKAVDCDGAAKELSDTAKPASNAADTP